MTATSKLIATIENYPHDGSSFMDRLKTMAAAASKEAKGTMPGDEFFDSYVFQKVNTEKDAQRLAQRKGISVDDVWAAYQRGSNGLPR